ncbi:MAG: hypothetical protein RSA99_03045 [Oscillospiraceae bacterium]
MYEKLLNEINYAKTSTMPREALYQCYGRLMMAFELSAITSKQYMKLSHQCVADGINNPKYF